jgi:hypothetical protein
MDRRYNSFPPKPPEGVGTKSDALSFIKGFLISPFFLLLLLPFLNLFPEIGAGFFR